MLIKQYHVELRNLRSATADDPEAEEALKKIADKLHARQAKLSEDTRKAVVPVRHKIKIELE
jgi:hypothetical protein